MTSDTMGVRQCTGCSVTKPLSVFSGDRTKSTGKASRCLECEAERRKRYRAGHYEQEKAYRLEREPTPKSRARQALRRAVARGDIVKPSACQDCGRQGLIHGHHHDYSQPFAVEWLCSRCHGLRHRNPAPITVLARRPRMKKTGIRFDDAAQSAVAFLSEALGRVALSAAIRFALCETARQKGWKPETDEPPRLSRLVVRRPAQGEAPDAE